MTRRIGQPYNAGMTIRHLRELQTARPFYPYTVRMAGGTELRVKHPEFVILNPDNRTVVLVDEDAGRIHTLDSRLMEAVVKDPLSDPAFAPAKSAAE